MAGLAGHFAGVFAPLSSKHAEKKGTLFAHCAVGAGLARAGKRRSHE
jgi:hypothetical protein